MNTNQHYNTEHNFITTDRPWGLGRVSQAIKIGCFIVGLAAAGTASAVTVVIQPTSEATSKDTKIYSNVANSNFSSNLNVVSPDVTSFFGLVQFSLSQLSASGATGPNDINNAVLRLYVTGLNTNNLPDASTSPTVQISPILNDWKETPADPGTAPLATYNAFFGPNPTLAKGSVVASQTVTGAGFYDWDITNLVKSWFGGTQPNYGVFIETPGPKGDVGIADVDSVGPENAPALVVDIVPEPSVVMLSGLSLLGILRRRRSSL